jgi:fatty acid desaturase
MEKENSPRATKTIPTVNWVHQPQYMAWAYLSLDPLGLSCDGWFREHNLQHHMYTNSPWDNHFEGTSPWLVTDPTVTRHVWQELTPYINPLILSFGIWASYIKHAIDIGKGNATFHPFKLLLIIECTAMIYRHGFSYGMLLMYIWTGVLGVYFFSLALMNHNSKRCHDIITRDNSQDWGEAQVYTCADWGVELGFFRSLLYLMLNYHTAHHLFPRVDFSHLPSIQRIIEKSCREHNIHYEASTFFNLYKEMVETFAVPQSQNEKVSVYVGGKKHR